MRTARLFKNGQSQAVRLPKEFRMPGSEVRISRHGGGVLLEPIHEDFSAAIEAAGGVSEDFMADGRAQPPLPVPRSDFE